LLSEDSTELGHLGLVRTARANDTDIPSHRLKENGYCECFNSKLRDELLNGEIFTTLREAQVLIEAWRRHYNAVRPHSSLVYGLPAPEASGARTDTLFSRFSEPEIHACSHNIDILDLLLARI
jgi:hypothetical protein